MSTVLAARAPWLSRPVQRLIVFAGGLACVGDGITTYVGVRSAGVDAEANPVQAQIMRSAGLIPALALRVLLGVLLFVLVVEVAERFPFKLARGLAYAVAVFGVLETWLVVANNYSAELFQRNLLPGWLIQLIFGWLS